MPERVTRRELGEACQVKEFRIQSRMHRWPARGRCAFEVWPDRSARCRLHTQRCIMARARRRDVRACLCERLQLRNTRTSYFGGILTSSPRFGGRPPASACDPARGTAGRVMRVGRRGRKGRTKRTRRIAEEGHRLGERLCSSKHRSRRSLHRTRTQELRLCSPHAPEGSLAKRALL